MESRETLLVITYNGKDVSTDIQPYIQSFSYHDNSKLEIDDIDLSLENIDKRWFGEEWFPNDGDSITVSIVKRRWDDELIEETLPCGQFYVDQIDFSPGSVSIKALAIPSAGNLTKQENSKGWEKISLKNIAMDVCNKHSIKLEFYSEQDNFYERIDQDKETDLAFLTRLCTDKGLNLKATENKIVIFDKEEFYEKEAVISVSSLDTDMIIDYKFSHTTKEIYDKVEVSYYDPEKKQLIREVYTKEELDEKRKTENEQEKSEKEPEAGKRGTKKKQKNSKETPEKPTMKIKGTGGKEQAQATMDEKNKEKETASMTLRGNFSLLAGQNVELTDFGVLSGKYAIEKSTHSLSGAYTTDIELKRIKE
jgi:phage protein D